MWGEYKDGGSTVKGEKMSRLTIYLFCLLLAGCLDPGAQNIGDVEAETMETESNLLKSEADIDASVIDTSENQGLINQGFANLSAGQSEILSELGQSQQGLVNLSAGMARVEAELAQTQQGLVNLSAGQTDVSGTLIDGGIVLGSVGLILLAYLLYKTIRLAVEKRDLERDLSRKDEQIIEVVRGNWDGRRTLPVEVYELAKDRAVVPEQVRREKARWISETNGLMGN